MIRITISDLELWTHIGVSEEERKSPQKILATIELDLIECNACETDEIDDTLDYETLANETRELAKEERKTLEKFAHEIATHVMTKGVQSVQVTLRKFILPDAKDVSVSVSLP